MTLSLVFKHNVCTYHIGFGKVDEWPLLCKRAGHSLCIMSNCNFSYIPFWFRDLDFGSYFPYFTGYRLLFTFLHSLDAICSKDPHFQITPQKVLAIPRKRWLRPNMTEKLFTGTLRISQPTNRPFSNYFYVCLKTKSLTQVLDSYDTLVLS